MNKEKLYDIAYKFVAQWEGGLDDDPDDPGGITKYGVCIRFLRDIRPDATREDIINLTQDEAKEIFKIHFWDTCKCDQLPDKIAFVMYDTAINVGVYQATLWLQRTANVQADGIIGKKTLSRVKEVFDTQAFAMAIINQRRQHYENLVRKNKKNEKFYKGWMNRTNALAKAIERI